MESAKELRRQLAYINKWESNQTKVFFWERISRLPFTLLDKITPAKIQQKLAVLVGELSKFVETGGGYLVNKDRYLKYFSLPSLAKVSETFSITEMDKLANKISTKRATFAKFQGATTGVGGVFTLAIDVPLLLGLSLKVLQETAMAYGFDPHDKNERIFIIKALQFAYADVVGKKAVLEELHHHDESHHSKRVISQLQGWREVFKHYSEHVGWKKLFQLVPVAGILFGFIINKNLIEEVAITGQMLYRKRRIQSRLEAMSVVPKG